MLAKFTRSADDIYSLRVEGESEPLGVTSEHPFFVRVYRARDSLLANDDDGEWRETQNLQTGDEIRLANGNWAKVLEVKFKGAGEVYNFTVAGNHNYFVGDLRLLTHNACPIKPYEVGTFDDLSKSGRSVSGDGLDIHHVVQKHPAAQVIPGYNLQTAPAIALPSAEHRLIRNLRGAYGGTPRQLLARDVRNLRNFTNTPKSAIKQLINLNKTMYPRSF